MPTKFEMQRFLSSALLSILVAAPSYGAGFGVFQQGAKAMGMAGAFTAQADDPSAMFHNVGGLAHQKERAFQLGATLVSIGATDFEGSESGFAAGATERSEAQLVIPPHFYWVEPLGDRWTFGLAVNSPFGLTSEWRGGDFSGRFLSRKASLNSLDVGTNLACKVSETLGVGFGVIVRFSEVELVRNLPGFDPWSGQLVDIAEITLASDLDSGIGYQMGLSSHPNSSWSWGLSYRSKIEVDYDGDGRLRQILASNAEFDASISAAIPFGRDLPFSMTIEFPDMASLGLAVKPSPDWLVELDINWTGWSSLTEYAIRFSQSPEFDLTLPQRWEDVYNYRLGVSRSSGSAGARAGVRDSQWRFGISFDQTPQPLMTLDPLLPDGDQSAVTLGYGFQKSSTSVDFALMYLDVEERTTRVNINGYNGTYASSALLFASTVTW